MSKLFKRSIAVVIALGIIIICLLFLAISGIVHIGNHGISVDSQGNVYIGLDRRIQVVNSSGQPVNAFSPQTSKGYFFTIRNDQILLSNDFGLYRMGLDGKVLGKEPSSGNSNMFRQQNSFQVNNDTYEITRSNLFYRVQVVHEGVRTTIYREPFSDLIATWTLLLLAPAWFVSVTFLLIQLRRKKQMHQSKCQ